MNHAIGNQTQAQKEQTDAIGLWRQYLGGNGAAGQAFLRRIMPRPEQPHFNYEAEHMESTPLPQAFVDVIESYDAAWSTEQEIELASLLID